MNSESIRCSVNLSPICDKMPEITLKYISELYFYWNFSGQTRCACFQTGRIIIVLRVKSLNTIWFLYIREYLLFVVLWSVKNVFLKQIFSNLNCRKHALADEFTTAPLLLRSGNPCAASPNSARAQKGSSVERFSIICLFKYHLCLN